MNVPNAITVARIALVPLFLFFAYQDSDSAAYVAFALFLIASLSDLLDGYLARKAGSITKVGEFLDPLADKLLVGAALFALVDGRSFPLWAALVIAVREVVIQIWRIKVVNAGGRLPASRFAKLKTALQITMVSWWLLPWESESVVHHALMIAALVATVLSGIEYLQASEKEEVVVEG